ncbi:MAG: RNA polymerase sigma factor [Patescibacteria group bacterium]
MVEQANQNLNTYFTESYKQFSDAIFRYCLYQTSNREKALDLTQDTFIKTWEYISGGKKVDNLKAFLYKVAGNLIIDYRRKKKADSLDQMKEYGFDVKSEINEMERSENVFEKDLAMQIINELDDKYKKVLLLKFAEDLSIKEIAKILKKSENNISVRIHRGIQKLKEILEKS